MGDPVATVDAVPDGETLSGSVALVSVCDEGCHVTLRFMLGKHSEERLLDTEALLADKQEVDGIDQMIANLRTAMRLDNVSPKNMVAWLKDRSFKV